MKIWLDDKTCAQWQLNDAEKGLKFYEVPNSHGKNK